MTARSDSIVPFTASWCRRSPARGFRDRFPPRQVHRLDPSRPSGATIQRTATRV